MFLPTAPTAARGFMMRSKPKATVIVPGEYHGTSCTQSGSLKDLESPLIIGNNK